MLLSRHYRTDKPDQPGPSSPVRPSDAAKKSEWVDYAIARGLHPGTLEELTKAEIQTVVDKE